jgi:hypothetical protein
MKKALVVIAQFLLFFMVFLAGSLADPFKMKWFISHPTLTSTRFFVPDGLILTLVLFLVILGIEVATKRLRTAGTLTSLAFALALILGIIAKFGWVTHDLF